MLWHEFLNHPSIWSWIIVSSSIHHHLPVVFLIKICLCHFKEVCACHFWFLVRMLYIPFLSNKILKVVPLACREKTLKHTPRTTRGDPVVSSCSWDFYLLAFPTNRLLFFSHLLKHVLSPTDICHKESEFSFHPSSHSNLGACGEYSEP